MNTITLALFLLPILHHITFADTAVKPVSGTVRVLLDIDSVATLNQSPTKPASRIRIGFKGRHEAGTDEEGRYTLDAGKKTAGEVLTFVLIGSEYKIVRPEKGKLTLSLDDTMECNILVATQEVIDKQSKRVSALEKKCREYEDVLSKQTAQQITLIDNNEKLKAKNEKLKQDLKVAVEELTRLGVPQAQVALEKLSQSNSLEARKLVRPSLIKHIRDFPPLHHTLPPLAAGYKATFDRTTDSEIMYSTLKACAEECSKIRTDKQRSAPAERRAAAAFLLWAFRTRGIEMQSKGIQHQLAPLGVEVIPLLVGELIQPTGFGQGNAKWALEKFEGSMEKPLTGAIFNLKSVQSIVNRTPASVDELFGVIEYIIKNKNTAPETKALALQCIDELIAPTPFSFLPSTNATGKK